MIRDLILLENPNAIEITSKYCNFDKLVEVLSNHKYNLTKDLGFSNKNTATLLTKALFPNKPPIIKINHWLLGKNGLKSCCKCNEVLELSNFNFNKSKADGLSTECKKCDYSYTKKNAKANVAKYKARKLEAIPPWANLKAIAAFYADCPPGYHVDHIYPLQGKNTCGLHVESNLQYLLAKDNLSKGNKLNTLP